MTTEIRPNVASQPIQQPKIEEVDRCKIAYMGYLFFPPTEPEFRHLIEIILRNLSSTLIAHGEAQFVKESIDLRSQIVDGLKPD